MRSLLLSLLLLLVLGSATGCATIVRGTTQKVQITTTPPGASAVIYPAGTRVTTPAEVKLPRDKVQTIRLELLGYEPAWSYLDRQSDWDAMLPYVGNLIFGGVIGMVIDLNSGAMLELTPTPVDVVLQPAREATSPAPAEAEGPDAVVEPSGIEPVVSP